MLLLENPFFCYDTSHIGSRAFSPGWKMKHCVFIGHLDYILANIQANI